MNNRLLVICGPTGTGKTKLALHLSKVLNGEIISADSRQVYKYMDIGTGKDVKGILGYDLVSPKEDFSVSQYLDFAQKTIRSIWESGGLPILVGGTGLYIKAVVDGIKTAGVSQNKKLRNELSEKDTGELFLMLSKIAPQKARSMNDSDRKNPRRLIRAIEIASAKVKVPYTKLDFDSVLFIGLGCPREILKRRIERRVEERIKNGFEKEVEFLKKNDFWDGVAHVTLGYRQWPDIEKWKKEEFKYAKRQMTWFKKDKRVNWFDITEPNFEKEVEILVKKWYS